MRELRQDYLKKYVKAIFIFLVFMLGVILAFFYCIQRDVEHNVESMLMDNVNKQNHHFRSILDTQYAYLEGIAGFIGESDNLLAEQNMNLIREIRETSDLERICIIDSDGNGYYDNGSVKNVSSRRYFKEGISGLRTLSNPLESSVDGETRVVLGVPVFHDDQVIGVLGGSYNVSTLSRLLFQDIYKSEGYAFILTADGMMVSKPDQYWENIITGDDNFFEICRQKTGDSISVQELEEDIFAERSGYKKVGERNNSWYVAYSPMGHNQWMVCYAVPASAARDNYQFIQKYELIMGVLFAAGVLCVLFYILRTNKDRQSELIRFANTDALTGLRNKKNTEDEIQRWLEDKKDEQNSLQVFFIMDIDYFKKINDQYGHLAGDAALRKMGSLLKSQFREDDILGRIGGDEFAVLMKNVASVENVETKAENLKKAVHELFIEELRGESLTCSMGISCCPIHGKSFVELYKHADIALYETKQNGRDGYTIYQSMVKTEDSDSSYVHRAYTELNPLTGLYYNKAFFKMLSQRLESIEPDTYVLIAVDIEHFSLFNRFYGRDTGDKILISVAACLKEIQEQYHGLAGYLSGDNFCILMPDDEVLIQKLQQSIVAIIRQGSGSVGFLPGFGVYRISDMEDSAMSMYDRATLALSHVYGNYEERIKYYESDMVTSIEEEITIVTEVQEGIEKREFQIYAQPQCNISEGQVKIVGAECLVRWFRDGKEVMSPGRFIPVLEKNGFISELDRYIWRQTCIWLKNWMDQGHIPVPLSVNVSRLDIFSMDIPGYFIQLAAEYQISPRLLKIEITEGVCAENNDTVNLTVKQLLNAGFSVLMDDFGSGYSSLNMLKDVTVNALKLDMRFLDIDEEKNNEKKGKGILKSVISMSRQMELPVIVEGVENRKQEEFLGGLGCRYVQGFYYYRPMPMKQFENLISDEEKLDLDGFTSVYTGVNDDGGRCFE